MNLVQQPPSDAPACGRRSRRVSDARRAAASALVLALVGLFVTGDFTSADLALAQPISSARSGDMTVLYGKIAGEDGPYRVSILAWSPGRKAERVSTSTGADGSYSLSVRPSWGIGLISVVGASGRERAASLIWLWPWLDYRLDGQATLRLKLWLVPVFGY